MPEWEVTGWAAQSANLYFTLNQHIASTRELSKEIGSRMERKGALVRYDENAFHASTFKSDLVIETIQDNYIIEFRMLLISDDVTDYCDKLNEGFQLITDINRSAYPNYRGYIFGIASVARLTQVVEFENSKMFNSREAISYFHDEYCEGFQYLEVPNRVSQNNQGFVISWKYQTSDSINPPQYPDPHSSSV